MLTTLSLNSAVAYDSLQHQRAMQIEPVSTPQPTDQTEVAGQQQGEVLIPERAAQPRSRMDVLVARSVQGGHTRLYDVAQRLARGELATDQVIAETARRFLTEQ